MQSLSAVIITKNEEKNIGKTLEALQQVADEIIVVDSLSTDATEEICKKYKVRFFSLAWQGYGPQKNFGIDKATHDVIINMDADEVLSAEAITRIKQLKEDGFKGMYAVKLVQFYFGKFMRYGMEKPTYRYRIFNRLEVKWDETPVHEKLVVPRGLQRTRLNVEVMHYSYHSVEQYMQKANNYTTLGANNAYKRGKRAYRMKIIFSPTFVFFKSFFLLGGFLDGLHGLIVAKFNANTNLLKYAKLRELIKNENGEKK